MSSTQTSESVAVGGDAYPIPGVVDYLIAVLIAVFGLALVAGGSALTFVVDRALIVDGVTSGSIQSTVLSEGDLIEVTTATVNWTGLGLLVTGLLLVVGGIAYGLLRRRSRKRRAAGEATSDFVANAVLGAAVSVLVMVVPFSPAVGGGLAGYLERGESERTVSVGTLSGLLAAAPLLLILAFVAVGVTTGVLAVGASGLAVVVGVAMLVALMVTATVGAGLGALGGFVGGKLADGDGF